MSNELLRMENITKIYDNGFMANKDITFSINKGEIHALIGENGAGKTTLMKILFGLESYQNGRIFINGEESNIANPLDAIDKGVGMVHQHFMQVPNLTVAENILLGIEPGKNIMFDKKEAIKLTAEAAEKFKLNVDPNALIKDLSVGYKQKVELLKALIRGVQVLILDEPTAVLTPQETQELFVQLQYLKDQGYGIIFISHKLDEVMEICDRVTVLRRGKVTGYGNIGDLDPSKLSRMMVERDVVLSIKKEKSQPKDVILNVDKLNYLDDGGKQILHDISFAIRNGEIVGIAGVEGNGQTELSEIITGLRQRTAGGISLNDVETEGKTIKQIRKLGLAHISEDRMTYGMAADLSVRDNIASIFLDDKRFKKGPILNVKALNEFVNKLIVDFEIACNDGNDIIRLLSGGNIQKVIIAREFSSNANFVVANQPTRGIDVGTAELIRKLLVEYTRTKNMGVLLISSDLSEIMEVSDRLLVMKNGSFVAQFKDLKMLTDEILGEHMLGIKTMTTEEMGLFS